jgi:hypothetical protein
VADAGDSPGGVALSGDADVRAGDDLVVAERAVLGGPGPRLAGGDAVIIRYPADDRWYPAIFQGMYLIQMREGGAHRAGLLVEMLVGYESLTVYRAYRTTPSVWVEVTL